MLEASVNWSKQCSILFTKPFENCHSSILSKTKMYLINVKDAGCIGQQQLLKFGEKKAALVVGVVSDRE